VSVPPRPPAGGLALPAYYTLLAYDTIDSTSDEAKRRALQGASAGTLVWARRQSGGRGRYGRRWVSPPGNVYLSLVLRPGVRAAEASQLSFVAALAVGEALAAVGAPPPRFKWPNDVLLGGRKVSGILLESQPASDGRIDWLVIGVGINVASHPEGTEWPATSLHAEGCGVAVEALIDCFAAAYLGWQNRWMAEGFAPVRAAWLARAAGLGGMIEVRLAEQRYSGVFEALDEAGALRLREAGGGERLITAGAVFLSGSERSAPPG